MTRLVVLLAILGVFLAVPSVVARLPEAPPRWRLRLSMLALVGLAASVITLLAAVLLPEVLVASRLSDVWSLCARAFEAIWSAPLGRAPSVATGAALSLVLGRLVWALLASARATRRARVRGAAPRRLSGQPVYVVPLEHPAAYSVGVLRPQIVVSRGLLAALDEEERRAVILHEEGHVRQRHHLVLTLGRSIAAALRPLAPARTALGELERSAEEAADGYAAASVGETVVASGLSKAALAGLAAPAGALSVARGADVGARVRRLLVPSRPRRWVLPACAVAAGVLLALLAVTQILAGLAVVAAAHHLVGLGAAATCPVVRPPVAPVR